MFLSEYVIVDFRDNNQNIPCWETEHERWLNLVHLALDAFWVVLKRFVFSCVCSISEIVNCWTEYQLTTIWMID